MSSDNAYLADVSSSSTPDRGTCDTSVVTIEAHCWIVAAGSETQKDDLNN